MLRGALAAFFLAVAPTWAAAEGRFALLIGNADYTSVEDLRNTVNDAQDIGATLGGLGYDVTVLTDLTRSAMVEALHDFRRRSHGAEHAIIYYAGHGIELDNANFLIPVDADLRTDLDVDFEAVPLSLFTRAASGGADLSLVILDACRNNPFLKTMARAVASRSVGKGLAEVEPGGHTLVAFAAKEGTVALDGGGRNSPYAAALIEVLEEPGVEINFVFRHVHDRVVQATAGQQQPHVYGALSAKQIYIHPPQAQPEPEPEPAPEPASEPGTSQVEQELELALWRAATADHSVDGYRDYLNSYPEGLFASAAQRRLDALSRAAVETTARLPAPAQGAAVAPAPPPEDAARTLGAADGGNAAPDPGDTAEALWAEIETGASLRAFQGFAARFPDHPMAAEADRRAETLRAALAPPATLQDLTAQLICDPGTETQSLVRAWNKSLVRARARLLQYQLQATGHYAGPLDARLGPQSRAALQAFIDTLGADVYASRSDVCILRHLRLAAAAAGEGYGAWSVARNFQVGGHGFPQDPALAKAWFENALTDTYVWEELPFRRAQADFAALLLASAETDADFTRARQLAEEGETDCRGKMVLGLIHRDALGVPQDLAAAVAYFERAQAQCPRTEVIGQHLEAARALAE